MEIREQEKTYKSFISISVKGTIAIIVALVMLGSCTL